MPTAVPTGAPDPPNKIRLVLELYGLFFDELFGHVPERPHSSCAWRLPNVVVRRRSTRERMWGRPGADHDGKCYAENVDSNSKSTFVIYDLTSATGGYSFSHGTSG